MLEKLTLDDFRERVGDAFRVHVDEGQAFEATLVEVKPLGTGVPGGRTPFSVVLRAPSTAHVPQQIYPVENAHLGTLEIFLVPIGAEGGGMRYEAVFT